MLVSPTPLAQTASYWAQGGLAAALAADDSAELHLRDTELAGRGLVRRSAAEILVAEAPDCVRDLQALGVRFDADRSGRLALGLEGGHSVRRVVHAGGSATGRRVVRQLSALVAAEPRIAVLEGARARALWSVDGAARGLICDDGQIVAARAVVLGTGGAAAMWARTTNPPGSQGIGLLLAHHAGAALADLELLQFHPTAVIGIAGREGFLSPRRSAARAPRCTTAPASASSTSSRRATRSRARSTRACSETGERSVGLDMRTVDPAHFPNVVSALREAGLDPDARADPRRPRRALHDGRHRRRPRRASTLPGLYAVGESSCTGLHGANRLASNSLSECFVFARRAVAHALAQPRRAARGRRAEPSCSALARAARAAARRRRDARRAVAGRRHRAHRRRACSGCSTTPHPLVRAIARCALTREESRGAHQRADHPERDPALDGRHVVLASDRMPAPRDSAT